MISVIDCSSKAVTVQFIDIFRKKIKVTKEEVIKYGVLNVITDILYKMISVTNQTPGYTISIKNQYIRSWYRAKKITYLFCAQVNIE